MRLQVLQRERSSLAGALLLLASVWSVLLLGASASPWLGREARTLGAYLLATGLVVANGTSPPRRGTAARLGAGVLLGLASWPGWMIALGAAFELLGLLPAPPPAEVGTAGWISAVVLAPVFEEMLYREQLLVALRSRVGSLAAVLATSLLFALPHLEPRSVLSTALVGLALGALRVFVGSLAACIGMHAGLNLAALVSARIPQ